MRGIIFDTNWQAGAWDKANNGINYSSGTVYRWAICKLKATTVLSKAEYAEIRGIPAEIETEEGTIANPAYEALESGYELNKYALMVGDDLDTYDEEGNVITPSDVVEITEAMKFPVGGG